MSTGLTYDLSQHLQQQVGIVIERHAKMAAAVLSPDQLSVMLMELAVAITLTAAGTACAMAHDEAGRAGVYDLMIEAIGSSVAGDRDRALAAVAERRAAAA